MMSSATCGSTSAAIACRSSASSSGGGGSPVLASLLLASLLLPGSPVLVVEVGAPVVGVPVELASPSVAHEPAVVPDAVLVVCSVGVSLVEHPD